ncbi:hypothetical protein BJF85_08375 [Saccharomonospora sp. CUA-673]|uniref:DedA family protein n=1 Tax=Saccharomonospora sp. CUA-673 TaxID=1904969 RepID=UPI0009686D0F|nr:DedA family protein [Saccharomonospora sp. CUA-673]OLT38701.1 hypothetical protein BJF85_08375 [Saccharomonospora sp. CUA-673]
MGFAYAEGAGIGLDWLATVGPVLLWLIVITFIFLECAVILGLFLPGDSLLFTTGLLLAKHGASDAEAWALAMTVLATAIVGNHVGYRIGTKTGTHFIARRNGKMLNQRNLDRAQDFLDRRGFLAIVLARWIPWVRTLAPMIAGAAKMNHRRFMLATVLGATIWVPTLVLIGYYGSALLNDVPWLKTTLIWAMVTFFVVGTAYGLYRYRQETRRPVEEPA